MINETENTRLYAKGNVIRRLRLEHVETQRELAIRAGLGLSTVYAAERGEAITIMSARKLAKALGLEASQVIEVRA